MRFSVSEHVYLLFGTDQCDWQQVWGLGGNRKINFWKKVVDHLHGMLPGQLSVTCLLLSLQLLTPAPSTTVVLAPLGLGGKEGDEKRLLKKKCWEQKKTKKRHFRYLKRCALADHRRTLKCMIKYWSGHPTAHNPDCYRSPMQVGTAWLQHSLMPRAVTRVWVTAQRETGQSRADPEMGSTTSPPADRSQSLCFLPAQIITSIASPRRERHSVNVTQGASPVKGDACPPPAWVAARRHCTVHAGWLQGADTTGPAERAGRAVPRGGIPGWPYPCAGALVPHVPTARKPREGTEA